jgi:hypothetical protein
MTSVITLNAQRLAAQREGREHDHPAVASLLDGPLLLRGSCRAADGRFAKKLVNGTPTQSPSTVVNMASVWFGSPLSRTTRTASATTSPTPSPIPSGVTENATSTECSLPSSIIYYLTITCIDALEGYF